MVSILLQFTIYSTSVHFSYNLKHFFYFFILEVSSYK